MRLYYTRPKRGNRLTSMLMLYNEQRLNRISWPIFLAIIIGLTIITVFNMDQARLNNIEQRKSSAMSSDVSRSEVTDEPGENDDSDSLAHRLLMAHELIWKFVKFKKRGFFVHYSFDDRAVGMTNNALFLEEKHGWQGVVILPDPVKYKAAEGTKINARIINACLPTGGTSGIKLFRREKTLDDGEVETEQFSVSCNPFSEVLNTAGYRNRDVDYFSIVSPEALKIIMSIPLNQVNIRVISVEIDEEEKTILDRHLKKYSYDASAYIKDGDFKEAYYVKLE